MAKPAPERLSDGARARAAALALDALEAALDRLSPGDDPEVVARALAEPVRAFDAVLGGAGRDDA